MDPRSGSASARISRRCGVDSATVHQRYVQHVTNPQKPSAIVVGLGNQNFFATGHVQCFLRKNVIDQAANGALRWGRPRSGAPIPPPVRLHWQACRWCPPQRRQHLVRGGEEQLSILRQEYQRRAGSSGSALHSRRASAPFLTPCIVAGRGEGCYSRTSWLALLNGFASRTRPACQDAAGPDVRGVCR